ncbi:putative metalloprotease CJM1_0395 family protein [Rheinheimera sp.]|uniref:putative metalloprotease CJM1_0395 family protein n=1 Tax=Rheinheimera sp. TaxID=1869214 RepID=UPI0027BA02EB|nr:putative metalloprotease CJM1_0395 family protein [Rheinheimera sp.]
MIITPPAFTNINPYPGNPAVDLARRENLKRDIIEPVTQAERGAAEKGVISEDKSRNHNTTNGHTYSDEIKNRGTELKQAIEGRGEESSGREQNGEGGGNNQNNSQGNSQDGSAEEKRQQAAEQREIAELKKRDAEVKAHEQAHASVGGQLAGSPSYSYQTGPDGQKYAVGGEVNIDLAEVPGDPQATIIKMQQVKAAALAPADPSGADQQIAAEASRRIVEAQIELAQELLPLNDPPASDGDYDATAAFAEMTGRVDFKDEEATAGLVSDDNFNTTSKQQQGDAAAEQDKEEKFSRYTAPETRSFTRDPVMQLRSDVIAGFYARATMPAERPLLQSI